MRFKCSPILTREEQIRRLTNWHHHFAWSPVRVAPDDCRWLETVNRRCPDARWFTPRRGPDCILFSTVEYAPIVERHTMPRKFE